MQPGSWNLLSLYKDSTMVLLVQLPTESQRRTNPLVIARGRHLLLRTTTTATTTPTSPTSPGCTVDPTVPPRSFSLRSDRQQAPPFFPPFLSDPLLCFRVFKLGPDAGLSEWAHLWWLVRVCWGPFFETVQADVLKNKLLYSARWVFMLNLWAFFIFIFSGQRANVRVDVQ